jgi:hypothetical protein
MDIYGDNITLLLHDGFVTKTPIDTGILIDRVAANTGMQFKYSSEIMVAA